MELNILLYTHTDYKDAWVPFFGQIKKYLPDAKLHVLVNKHDDNLPKDVTTIYYDDSKLYTERLKYGLNKLNYDEILFIHEDMFLFDKPNIELIEKYLNYIKNDLVDSIKLIYVNDGNEIISHIDQTLILNSFSKFSIQPTLIKKKTLLNKLEQHPQLNIYSFEEQIKNSGKDFMAKIGGEKKRGIFHYDSLIFPYIATAIVKGKWNYSEYKNELSNILKEYNIDETKRGLYI